MPGGGEPGHARADLGEDHVGVGQADAGDRAGLSRRRTGAPDSFADGRGRGLFSAVPDLHANEELTVGRYG